jgi:beta-phosphoglucomutase-like phosphatase (HAD superfamily)
MTALVFDCDGVLAESERDGHLEAFNRAFADFGVPVRWSEAEYREKLLVSGGKERVATILTSEVVRAAGLPGDPDGQRDWLERLHARKASIFRELVGSGGLRPRTGVVRLVDEAVGAGWTLAVASTASEGSVSVILDTVLGPRRAERFAVFAGDVVAAKKPDPAIYSLVLERLGTTPAETIVVEDSRNGLLAASGAGLRCVITVSHFSEGEDFTGAALVVSSLGDPGEPMTVLANRSGASPDGYLRLRDLAAVLAPRHDGDSRLVENR